MALGKLRNYVYGVRFIMETNTNTLVHELNLPANDQPGAVITHCFAWIGLFDLDMKPVPERMTGHPEGHSVVRWRALE